MRCNRCRMGLSWIAAVSGLLLGGESLRADSYLQQNLVSDGSIAAAHTDTNLVNPWGIVFNPGGFWWVADNGTGVSTLYDNNGFVQSLVVQIPPPLGNNVTAAPTGIVVNTTNDFVITDGVNSGPARFIFCTEDGTLSAWNASLIPSTKAVLVADRSSQGAIYKGLALANTSSGNELFVADFHNNRIDVFGPAFQPVTLGIGAFLDLTLPSGYAPFNVAEINGRLFVAYAKQDATGEDEIAGPGNGYVNEFNTQGVFIRRFASTGTLNAPWAIVEATGNFGQFSGAILVGNFGDGRINAFNRISGAFLGQLQDANNNPIEIDGLWGLSFGAGSAANDLFFAAGPNEEQNGLFGKITAVTTTPVPPVRVCGFGTFGAMAMTLLGFVGLRLMFSRRRD